MIPSIINLQIEYVSYADEKIPSVKLLNLVVDYDWGQSTNGICLVNCGKKNQEFKDCKKKIQGFKNYY